MPTFYEFFAGGGMARAGLGPGWTCLFANDVDPKKVKAYRSNWGDQEMREGDVGLVSSSELPGTVDMVWASFPCQDLSLAGNGAGLKGSRSGTFWPFWRLIENLGREGRQPATIVLENVCGALTSRKSADFRSLVDAMRNEGFRCGALVVDAQLFLPHSRPRLFVVGVREGVEIDERLVTDAPQAPFHTSALTLAYSSLSSVARASWLWWRLPVPNYKRQRFIDLIDEQPSGVAWHTREQTQRLLGMMSPVNLAKLEAAMGSGTPVVGALYKRTRPDASGGRVQRAEVRFDDTAGCLRTPNGGSSRQTILVVHGSDVRSRLLSARETARLMGLPDTYRLPSNYNEAYHLTGDGVAVPVVRHIAEHLLEPLVDQASRALTSAA